MSHSSIPASLLLVTATVGNTLGALTTLGLGVFAEKGYSRIRVVETQRIAVVSRLRKWGTPVLLFSWLPVVGDTLCFAAGWLHLPVLQSAVAISIGKLLRYAVIVYLFA
ncbi:MAG: YqaA family protein [Methylococcales bacterium]